jgi:hypothetical protein
MSGKMLRAAAMRADGVSFDKISETLGIHSQTARKAASGVDASPKEDKDTVVRYFANNGGCSTRSGLHPVRLPRIPLLHGEAA